MKTFKTVLKILGIIALCIIGLIVALLIVMRVIQSAQDDRVISAARESIVFIDDFYKKNGYYPCEREFYEGFWAKEFNGAAYNDGQRYDEDPSHTSSWIAQENGVVTQGENFDPGRPVVDYRSLCTESETRPQDFLSLCFEVFREGGDAFGAGSHVPSFFIGPDVFRYCVAGPESSKKDPDLYVEPDPDYRQFLPE